MTVVTSSSPSVTTSSAVAGTTAIGSASSTRTGETIDISNLCMLIQETKLALMDTLQKRSISQIQNISRLAVASLDQNREAAAKTASAALGNGLAGGLGAVLGGGLGLSGIKGGKWETISQLSTAVPALGTAAGGLGTMNITQAASRLQAGANYINDSKNTYDKQSDVDSNMMRSLPQKMTDMLRTLVELDGKLANAISPK